MIAKAKNNSKKQTKLDKPTNYKKYIIIGGALLIAIILFFMYIAFERYQLYRAEKTIDSIANELSMTLPDLGQPNKEKYCTYPSTKMPTIGRKPICTIKLNYNTNKDNNEDIKNTLVAVINNRNNINTLSGWSYVSDDLKQQSLMFDVKNTIVDRCYISLNDDYLNNENALLTISCGKKTLFEYFKSKE